MKAKHQEQLDTIRREQDESQRALQSERERLLAEASNAVAAERLRQSVDQQAEVQNLKQLVSDKEREVATLQAEVAA